MSLGRHEVTRVARALRGHSCALRSLELLGTLWLGATRAVRGHPGMERSLGILGSHSGVLRYTGVLGSFGRHSGYSV